MTSLLECLAKTKFRVFEVGDRIVHEHDPEVCVIKSFHDDGRGLMKLDNGSWGYFATTYWSKVR